MPPSVAVVTDSTAYLPEEAVSRLGITVVPLQVVVGGRGLDDVAQIDGAGMNDALGEWAPVTTSRPAPQRFADAYEAAAARGAAGIVSIHLSGEMSGTVEAARAGAEDSLVPVEVVDSRSIAMGLGFPVLAAAEAAARGARRTEVADAARRRMKATRTFFYVDTLEHLRRGGRIGAAATLLGSALRTKPLLHIADGVIVPLEKVRTASRAIARLEDLAVQAAGSGPVDIAVQHLAAEDRAGAMAARLPQRVPGLASVTVVEVGAVIGAHVGPGMLGLTVSPHC
ncbi:DegV family protein [Streptosporangium pseudovulgare]|uniref:DegV domain-containing protein n=1 Tax=Streptosporangium pseudovulgare TaxID=35765 RepID=A0ABQ2QHQ4_9ACTN|nr:DegV family protein [Streptosporangium pseudovulgare]GGP80115.1 DegV domain-containing protein [Streptosporangium pseudovulgare]